MANEKVDRRVIQILRWSIIVQIIFLLLSSFSPLFSLRNNYLELDRADYLSFASVISMMIILILISFKNLENRITKRVFLIILYSIALITVFSRHLFSFSLRRLIPDTTPAFFRWDAIFFLIIPLVFIGWQFSLKSVLTYCLVVLFADAIPLFFEPNKIMITSETSILMDTDKRKDLVFLIADFMGIFARSVILGIVGWIENSLVTLQRSQHNQLAEANKKLQKYALTSEKLAQTQERNRLARELHDTLAHTLSSTSVQLEAIKALFDRNPDQAKAMLDQTLTNTKNGLAETRRALVDLRASELEAYGLTQAIKNTVQSAAERGGFTIDFQLDKELDMLPEDISHGIYRTIQEAVENILRHSNASKAVVSLKSKGNQIELSIRDNGKGFNPRKLKKEHLGVRGMQERIEMLGGTFNIESNEKSGTRIFISLENKYD
jgi:signal transduction histidine kinase